MRLAAVADVEANTNKEPATSKLKMLPEVISVLEKFVIIAVVITQA